MSRSRPPTCGTTRTTPPRVTGRLSFLQGTLDRFVELETRIEDISILVELGRDEGDADSLAEAERELGKVKKAVEGLEVRTLLNGEYDAREALVSIRSGAGGVDAADFAETLMRMYVRWAEQHDYKVEVYETSYAEEAGLKSATFAIHAPYAYGTLSVESGTHRLVRISPFDNQGRRQTSFAAVEVVPVLEQTDEIEVPDEEIRVDVYRSGGPGGQSVNTTDSAVRLTHLPTGTVVSCQNEKSQLQNKASAMVVLKAKLLARKKAEEKAHLDSHARRRPGQLGRPDAQLRAQPLPGRQGPPHRLRGRQPHGGLRRRPRRLPRGRHPLATRQRDAPRRTDRRSPESIRSPPMASSERAHAAAIAVLRDHAGPGSRDEPRVETFLLRLERWWPDLLDRRHRAVRRPRAGRPAPRRDRRPRPTRCAPPTCTALDERRLLQPDWIQQPGVFGYACYTERFAGGAGDLAGIVRAPRPPRGPRRHLPPPAAAAQAARRRQRRRLRRAGLPRRAPGPGHGRGPARPRDHAAGARHQPGDRPGAQPRRARARLGAGGARRRRDVPRLLPRLPRPRAARRLRADAARGVPRLRARAASPTTPTSTAGCGRRSTPGSGTSTGPTRRCCSSSPT